MSITIERGRSLRREALAGLLWLLAQNVVARGITFASQLVLAWLLAPQDFGVIGLASTVTALAPALINYGLDEVLLQRQATARFWLSTAVLINAAFGLIMLSIVLILAPVLGRVYGSAQIPPLMILMGLAVPLAAITLVPSVSLRSDMQFRFIATYNIFETICMQVMTVLLAWWGAGAYSFAIPVPCLALVKALIFWRATPRLRWQRPRLRLIIFLLRRGSLVFAQRIITESVGQGDYFILGLLATKLDVGSYVFAFRLAAQPIRMLAGSFQNVLFPALARLKGEPTRQGRAALRAAEALSCAVMPLCFLQAALATPLTALMFGNKWMSAAPIMRILSIGLAFDAVSWIAGCLLAARGEFSRSLRLSMIFSPVFFVLASAGAWLNMANGCAVGVSIFYAVITPIYSYAVFRRAGVSLADVAIVYIYPTAAAAVAMGVGSLLSWKVQDVAQQIVVVGIIGPTIYIWWLSIYHPEFLRALKTKIFSVVIRSSV